MSVGAVRSGAGRVTACPTKRVSERLPGATRGRGRARASQTREDPWRKPASEARREAARRTMTRLNARRRAQDGTEPSASPPDHGIAPFSAEGSEAALIWATSRVDQAPVTVLHRVDGGGTGQGVEKSQSGSIAVGDDVVTIFGDPGDGRGPTTIKMGPSNAGQCRGFCGMEAAHGARNRSI